MSRVISTWYINIYGGTSDSDNKYYSIGTLYETKKEADADQGTPPNREACLPIEVVLDAYDGSFIKFVGGE